MSRQFVKVFSATTHHDRNSLGDRVTDWLAGHPEVQGLEIRTLQSSDEAYHCLTFIVLGRLP